MSKLPKFDLPGHVHFVTTNVYRNVPLFLAHDFCNIVLSNIDYYRRRHIFRLIGYVIMLDHFHALIQPQNDVPIRRIIQDIKRYSAKQIRERLLENPVKWSHLGGMVINLERLELARKTPAQRCITELQVPRLADFEIKAPRTKGQEHQI